MSVLAITGCGIDSIAVSSSGTATLRGMVHGGQQPVSNSTIELYAAGKTGNGSPSVKMIAKQVLTLADGSFTISGDYTCSADTDQVYLVATGGNPGFTPAVDNPALVMMTAFGSCVNLPSAAFVEINEVTTAAAAWALAPFITSSTAIGASSTNANGIASAFRNAQLLADSSTGLAVTLPSTLAIETNKLYALADALAPCVNSNGTTGCASLFTAASVTAGTASANTLNAALSIVQNPGRNVAGVYAAINAQAPFPIGSYKAPHDWTMSLTLTGGALHSPSALAVDGFNNVWVANYYQTAGTVSAFSPQGAPLQNSPYGSGILIEVYGLAVDFNNNVWVTNEENPTHNITRGSVTAFHGAEPGTIGAVLYGDYIFDNSIDYPFAIAADPDGDMLIVNNANSSVTEYTNLGVYVTSGLAAGESSLPVAISPDLDHGFWLANGDSSVTHIDKNGNQLARVDCCDGANGVATDSLGNAWIANYYAGSVSELASAGAVEATTTGGGLSDLTDPANPTSNAPSGISVDAGQNVWAADYYGANFSEIAGSANTLAAGTPISPSTGYGLDAHLLEPFSIAPDAAGNLWVSNFGNSTLTMFFGLATPTKTPLSPSPTAP